MRLARPWVTKSAVGLLRTYAWLRQLRQGKMNEPLQRLLVTSTGGVGDGVLVGSLIHHLRICNPELRVGILAKFGARDALATIPGVRIHDYTGGAGFLGHRHLIRDLRNEGYDTAFATDHTSLTTAALLCLALIPRKIGFEPLCDCPQARLYTESVRLDETNSQWHSLMQLVRLLEPRIDPNAEVVPLPIDQKAEAKVTAQWQELGLADTHPAVGLHLGGGVHEYKRWPLERFVAVAEAIRQAGPNGVVLLTGQAAERSLIEAFQRSYSGKAIDLSWLETLQETGAVIRRCDLLIANDSGIMHLGAALGIPTVGLFGPASPIQWAPRGPRATFLQPKTVSCSPCIRNYRGIVPAGCKNQIQSACLREITVEDVMAASRQVVGSWLT